MTIDSESRPLFGGAISVRIAKGWLDASDLRQVPDNQEVLLSTEDGLTLIVEVLEKVKEGQANDDLESAIRFHFDSLAHDNDAGTSNVQQIYALPGTTPTGTATDTTTTPAPLLLVGEQRVKKFGQTGAGSGEGDRVRIYVALWRLSPAKDVDLIMSLNEPLESNDLTDAEQAASAAGSASAKAQEVFHKAASSLSIHDWSLFAH